MSRLDRLVVLLETGSTPFIRNTAADQLLDLAKGHPEDTVNLLGRVYPFLKSKKWETRIAAARAFGGIVNHSELWDPNNDGTIKKEQEMENLIKQEVEENVSIKIEQDEELQKFTDTLSNLVNFSQFELHLLLQSKHKLVAAKLDEEDNIKNTTNGDHANGKELDYDLFAKLKRHRAPVKQEEDESSSSSVKLETGNSPRGETPMLSDSSSNSPVISAASTPQPIAANASTSTPSTPGAGAGPGTTGNSNISSARLKMMMKRKAKAQAKSGVSTPKPIDLHQSSVSRKLVSDGLELKQEPGTGGPSDTKYDITSQQGGEKLVLETKAPELEPLLSLHMKVAGLVWEFQGVYELLLNDLFDDTWEIRHGAALGLRELLKKHSKGAGRIMNKSLEENNHNNRVTLEDLAVRLCALFALDRFGDFVSDTVVAPVRESGAQTLAALLLHLDDDIVFRTFDCLYDLVMQKNELVKCWEAKHGGMLGLRYFVGVRTDILLKKPELMDDVFYMVLNGLKESDDDVQSVAALTLSPIASEFVSMRTNLLHELLNVIWDALTNLRDDLSASIGSVMDLLSKLCTHKECIDIIQHYAVQEDKNSFQNLVPRLFPFLRHPITNVRKAVLRTLLEFLSIEDEQTKKWINENSLRLIFQNLLVEQNKDVLELSHKVCNKIIDEMDKNPGIPTVQEAFVGHFKPLLSLLMTPIGIARFNYQMNTTLIMRPSGQYFGPIEDVKKRKRRASDGNGRAKMELDIPCGEEELKVNIDAPMFKGDVMLVGYDTFMRTRSCAADAYGRLLSYVTETQDLEFIFQLILKNLSSAHSTPRLFGAMVVQSYAHELRSRELEIPKSAVEAFSQTINTTLAEPDSLPYFRELVPTLKSVRTCCLQLFDSFISNAKVSPSKIPQLPVVVQGEEEAGSSAFGLENAEKILNDIAPKLTKSLSASSRMSAHQSLEDAKHRITVAMEEVIIARSSRNVGILSAYASAILELSGIPKKLNPVIRSLMDSVKQEESSILQQRSATSVSHFVKDLINAGKNGPVEKIVRNLCAFLCVDTSEVPEFFHNKDFRTNILSLRKEEARTDPIDIAAHQREVHEAKIKRNGAILALEALLDIHKEDIFVRVPILKSIMVDPLQYLGESVEELVNDPLKGQSIVDALGVIRALLAKLNSLLYPQLIDQLTSLLPGFKSDFSVLRYSTAKCFATICSVMPTKSFTFLVKYILPMLSNAGAIKERQGAIESIYHLSSTMGAEILPYIVFLIVPVLGRMSDSDNDVRVLATSTFASIIKLVPLEAGIPDPKDMPQELLEGRDRERDFIQQMMDPTKIKPFDLPVTIKATLRKYQQEGVNWLAFLNKYHLHGILCDDMGLGKTLQTLCIVASDHHIREEKFAETGSPEYRKLPSLIVCPPSLTGHWEQEIKQYAPFLKVLVYAGGPSVRSAFRSQFRDNDIVVTSYDICRNDVDHIIKFDYNYCVLDEGHIIKSAPSKLTKSVKRIRAEHRLILSGTPIQNNVLELWSLFDFLMPGFLGTEKVFHEKFAKPIAASRNSKTSSKEQEAGALALESLHKQVLPFMLRRLKEDVLSDLPPKIIQDYYCELSEIQKRLYREFATKQKSTVQEEVLGGKEEKSHVFQALQYMRKLCNHPALVLSAEHPKYAEVQQLLAMKKSNIRNIEHAPKLLSLKNLLLECGIGTNDVEYSSSVSSKLQQQQMLAGGVISEHRALIFCQLKDMLDIVENELLRKHMPSVTYMRLDGSTDPRDRQSIVRKFNEDPSIDILLLTTKVGGLGLNLTGADTVIFVEHDWNPMNDLQAMDRAHRLGQKKVVNVYRLITKNTLEEKIMGLQKFKMNIASTIVNQQNAGLASMDTNQLLDLFDVDELTSIAQQGPEAPSGAGNDDSESKVPDVAGGLTGKAAGAVGELADLWDESQYEEEYNLDAFIQTLK
ncbi:TATA-binding protein-associated factor mot1 [Scheffersomyces spartinae]|uniref:TATA-binding protein-associated factor mot1 n=1 Tax=Scheffersomyces spartinae TaxID=45513 RepID=A0A9P7V6V9_9ASCO|nr:TATA-binding protein-associated factor mot1 [Scheffersomyces spartinae]KAG7192301.1 TATA-binding protein-associated factor mot1 [Scheffersomyces spartinae]